MVYRLGELFCGPGGIAWGATNADIGDPEYRIVHQRPPALLAKPEIPGFLCAQHAFSVPSAAIRVDRTDLFLDHCFCLVNPFFIL